MVFLKVIGCHTFIFPLSTKVPLLCKTKKNMMKMKLLVLALTLMQVFNSSAQVELNLDSLDGATVNGTEILYESNVSMTGEFMYFFYVTNNTGSDQEFKISRKSILEPSGWSNYLCWDICYIPSQLELWTSSPSNVVAGESKYFSTYVTSPSSGTAHYRYYVSTDGMNFIDSVDVKISNLNAGITENDNEFFKVYPNPVTKNVYILNESNTFVNFLLYDNKGILVLSEEIEGVKTSINISRLKSGLYFYSLFDREDKILFTSKMIIEK